MNFLITGAAGFLGSSLANHLAREGHQVRGLDDLSTGDPQALAPDIHFTRGDVLGLLVFFELTGVCSLGLIGYYDNEKARRAALKAIITTQVVSLGLYMATAYFFATSGSLNLTDLAALTDEAKISLGVLIAGFGKSAQLPFHFWLPEAMVAQVWCVQQR